MLVELKEMSVLQLADFLRGGCNNLAMHKDSINALNVFPVPDGDTGINMYLTIQAAVKNIADPAKNSDTGKMAQNFSLGALMGARGNSGVILSQMFRGFAQGIDGKKTVSARDFAAALQKGADLSYKSVMKPVEGTMLTVFKDFALGAVESAKKQGDILIMLRDALKAGEKSLANTPNLLPVLKQAGVVDAGGQGILTIMEGGLAALRGEAPAPPQEETVMIEEKAPLSAAAAHDEEIAFTYCSEVMIYGKNPSPDEVKALLVKEIPGDSLIVVGMDEVVKIHYHSNAPWKILEIASRFGELRDIKIDNMRVQHQALSQEMQEQLEEAPAPPSKCGVLTVCVGEGMKQIFNKLGAAVVSGGQTMNPSAEEIINAVEEMPAESVIILPNNSNIILAANQAKKLIKKPVQVLESRFVTQGLGAMLAFDSESSLEENYPAMAETMAEVVSGELTFAVRDSNYEDKEIKNGDILALLEGKLIYNGQGIKESALTLIEAMLAESSDPSIITLFYGHDVKEEDAAALTALLEDRYDDLDIECRFGGQPLYYYLIAVE